MLIYGSNKYHILKQVAQDSPNEERTEPSNKLTALRFQKISKSNLDGLIDKHKSCFTFRSSMVIT